MSAERTTRRAALAASGLGAGALAARLAAAREAEAQVLPPDDRYVWRERMPINVKDHGATGNGNTDDRAAIQSAIDAATAAGGGTVFFPPGDYRVDPVAVPADYNPPAGQKAGLTIRPNKPIRLLGSGMALAASKNLAPPTRLIRKTAGGPLLWARGTSYTDRVALEVDDLEFRGSATTGTLVHIERGNTVQFHRVTFIGVTGTGLLMRNVFNSSGSDLRWWRPATPSPTRPACSTA